MRSATACRDKGRGSNAEWNIFFLHYISLLPNAGSIFNSLATLGKVYFYSYAIGKSRWFIQKFKFGRTCALFQMAQFLRTATFTLLQ
jgi:hypothetical protein